MTPPGGALEALVDGELAVAVPPGAQALTARLREQYGPALRAVVLYGSCLRASDDRDGLLDLYALVTSYRAAYRSRTLALLNQVLPPNVFYLEARVGTRPVRAKVAVLAEADLGRLVSPRTFEPYFWARFAQPCALVWAADDAARAGVVAAFAHAIATFVRRAVPLAPGTFTSRELWTAAWGATYASEVRPERPGAAAALWASGAARYEAATALAVAALPWPVATVPGAGEPRYHVDLPAGERRRAARAWTLRRAHAKVLFLLRILRNGLIFEGGVDYVLWKIQRHSGVAIDQSWRSRRHPLLALGAEAWRLYRAGAFR